MSTSIIRSLYTRVMTRHRLGETEEMAKDAGIPAVLGFGLGYLGGKGKLDRSGVPMDAVGGALAMAGTIFTPLLAKSRDTIRGAASVAIGVGMSRVGERYAKTGSMHGEYDGPGSFGEEPLVAAARNL
jgi:hypothetical protein